MNRTDINTLPANLNAALTNYAKQYQAINSEVGEMVSRLSNNQFNWRPDNSDWSIAECIDHLTLTGREFLPIVDKLIGQARTKGWQSDGPFHHGFFGNLFIKAVEPPVKLKVKAPAQLQSHEQKAKEQVQTDFANIQQEYLRRIKDANGLDLAKVKEVIPFRRYIKLSLGQWLQFVAAHERRHLWQMNLVKAHKNFPAN
jgi:uncharacterized damage-inducible protein DinB